jgi:hypothetical protein
LNHPVWKICSRLNLPKHYFTIDMLLWKYIIFSVVILESKTRAIFVASVSLRFEWSIFQKKKAMNSLENLSTIHRNESARKRGSVPLILNPSNDEYEEQNFQVQALNCDEIETIGSASSIFLRLCNEKVPGFWQELKGTKWIVFFL